MNANLERRYRRALTWYPRGWREKNADVVVGTLLDVAEADHRTRPRRGELVGLAASGLSVRFGVILEPSARNAISTVALTTGVAYPLVYFALQAWSPWSATRDPLWHYSAALGFHAIVNPGLVIAAAWLLALILAFARPSRPLGAKAAIALAIFACVALVVINRIPNIGAEWYGLTTTSMVFLAVLGVLALIGTPARGVRLLICTAATAILILGMFVFIGLITAGASLDERTFWRALSEPLVVIVCAAALVAVGLGIAGRRAATQTLLISAIPWSTVTLRALNSRDMWNALALLGIAVLLVGFGALLPLAFRNKQPTKHESKMPLG